METEINEVVKYLWIVTVLFWQRILPTDMIYDDRISNNGDGISGGIDDEDDEDVNCDND